MASRFSAATRAAWVSLWASTLSSGTRPIFCAKRSRPEWMRLLTGASEPRKPEPSSAAMPSGPPLRMSRMRRRSSRIGSLMVLRWAMSSHTSNTDLPV